ncbi:MAG: hypothetical protein U0794_09840 [Isosphaeraceae bacterium]
MAQSPAGVHFTERTKTDVLNRDFLEARARILDLAASLDRLERAPRIASEPPDGRLAQLRRAIEALLEPGADRAETVQLIFSLEYDPSWRSHFGLD